MRSTLLGTVFGALIAFASVSASAGTVVVAYSPLAPDSNFSLPTPFSNTTAYTITTSQDANNLYFKATQFGPAVGGSLFSNVYLGGLGPVGSFLGFEVTNNRAFAPGQPGYYDLSGRSDYTSYSTGSLAAGNAEIGFSLAFSFLTDNPLNIPTIPTGAPPGTQFAVRLSQTFGYSVAGGDAYGDGRLGVYTLPASQTDVPEPASLALIGMGVLGLGFVRSRRKA